MAKAVPVRTWATPLTISAFALMASTGVLMFFGLDRGLITVVHQWFSWLFLAGAAGHIVANVRPFKNHLKKPFGRASLALVAAVLVASFSAWGLITGPQLERPIEEALVDAPLSSLAGVTRTTPAILIGRFQKHGISATPDQSIRALSIASGVGENRLLGLVFLPDHR
jgi:hypothetical protein